MTVFNEISKTKILEVGDEDSELCYSYSPTHDQQTWKKCCNSWMLNPTKRKYVSLLTLHNLSLNSSFLDIEH